jgi:hypothetical protein
MAITISGDTPNFTVATITTLTSTTLSDGTNSTSSTNAIQGSAKAWVNFNGVTTASVNSSYNVSSVTRNSVGNYTINFTAGALSSATYAVSLTCTAFSSAAGLPMGVAPNGTQGLPLLKSTTQLQIITGSNINYDAGQIYVVVFNS